MDRIHRSVLADIEQTLNRELVGLFGGRKARTANRGSQNCSTAPSRVGRPRAGYTGGDGTGSRRPYPPTDVHVRRPGAR